MATRKIKLKTPWKNRVAFVLEVGADVIFLLVHPSGELLLICQSDRYGCGGAARWDKACILWIEEREGYWMCKYGIHDKKYSLSGLDEDQLTTLAVSLGIEFIPKLGKKRVESPMMLDSLMARNLLNWANKHPKMAKENVTVISYRDEMTERGILPLPNADYTGY
ncbi:MAG: hypothetical protein V7749_00595 [Cocleimonas sp.]